MTWCYSRECGVNTVIRLNVPAYNVTGDRIKCPTHGLEIINPIIVPFGKACPKCGLIQYINGSPVGAVKMAKYNGYKCTDCNHILVDEPNANYYSCVRCGRAYNSILAKKTSNKKCPHCGGNTRFL